MPSETIRDEWISRYGRGEPKVLCVGLNYRDHTGESGMALPEQPLFFAKFANTLCANGDPIVLPPAIGHVDAEAELAVVIGRMARNVDAAEAIDVIDAYTCANDVSAREAQFGDSQWFRGKGYDTFCPIGPRLVAAVELSEASNLRIVQRVNGEVLQDSRTNELIFDVPALVAYASTIVTLLPGDIILTGTPEGVGFFREPKVALRDGDLVEIEIDGIGVLSNPVTSAS
jgi:2-keto-4-pentenoate hydratase/2-oxohepta-3-ene-1,7-dioic acid hydratase in catechol pathway